MALIYPVDYNPDYVHMVGGGSLRATSTIKQKLDLLSVIYKHLGVPATLGSKKTLFKVAIEDVLIARKTGLSLEKSGQQKGKSIFGSFRQVENLNNLVLTQNTVQIDELLADWLKKNKMFGKSLAYFQEDYETTVNELYYVELGEKIMEDCGCVQLAYTSTQGYNEFISWLNYIQATLKKNKGIKSVE